MVEKKPPKPDEVYLQLKRVSSTNFSSFPQNAQEQLVQAGLYTRDGEKIT